MNAVTEVSPETLKEMSTGTLDMGKIGELMKKLKEALAKGDKEEAMRLAKELSKELNAFNQAMQNMMNNSGLGKMAKTMKNAGQMKSSLEEMLKKEKEIYTETAAETSVDLEKLLKEQEETANIIINHLDKIGVKTSYGRAAKIISIYIKTAVIIRDSGKGSIAKYAHPPIDAILLTNLHREHKNIDVSTIKWTQLSEANYFKLIEKLRTIEVEYFWELEKYWIPSK